MPKATKKPAARQKKIQTQPVQKAKLLSQRVFTKKAFSFIRANQAMYLRLLILLSLGILAVTGVTQYSVYSDLSSATEEVSGQISGVLPKHLAEVGALFASVLSGTLLGNISESQQLILGLIYLSAWLTCIWIVRNIMAGNDVSLRDGLYSGGAPLIGTLLVMAFAILQLLPLALLVSLVSVVASTGALSGWLLVPAFIIILLAAAGTLYWITSTFFAAIIATIPGTYPWMAIISAKTVVSGYRPHIIKRVLWLGLVLLLVSIALLVPIITFDALLGYPFTALVVGWVVLVGAAQFIFSVTYLYKTYREVIDERA